MVLQYRTFYAVWLIDDDGSKCDGIKSSNYNNEQKQFRTNEEEE